MLSLLAANQSMSANNKTLSFVFGEKPKVEAVVHCDDWLLLRGAFQLVMLITFSSLYLYSVTNTIFSSLLVFVFSFERSFLG